MATAGEPISHEFRTAWSPEEATRNIALRGEQFGSFGYRVEQQTADSVVLVRRFTPTVAWAVPLIVAAGFFLLGVVGPNATTESAATAGRIVFFALAAAVVLALVVKTNERMTFSASPDGNGSRVIVSGSATPELRDYLRSWAASAQEEPGIAPEPA